MSLENTICETCNGGGKAGRDGSTCEHCGGHGSYPSERAGFTQEQDDRELAAREKQEQAEFEKQLEFRKKWK